MLDSERVGASEEVTPYWEHFQTLSRLSWQTAASYTFPLEMVAMVYLLSHVDHSDENLAAITLITSYINALICFGISPLLAMSIVAGEELGELNALTKRHVADSELTDRRKHIAAVYGNGLIASAVAAPCLILPMVYSKSIFTHVFHQHQDVAAIAGRFIRLYATAVPANLARITASEVMFVFKRTKPAMTMGLANFAVSTTAGGVLAFGLFGAPKLGSTGVLAGAVLNEYLSAGSYTTYLAKSSHLKDFQFFKFCQSWQPYFGQLKKIRGFSRTILLGMVTETGMQFMLTVYAGMLSVNSQAACSSIMQLSIFSVLLQVAFGQTAAQEISRAMGANQFENASRSGRVSLAALLGYILPVMIFFSAYPTLLADIQNNHDEEYRDTLTQLAPLMFAGCALDAARFSMLQQLRVLGDAKVASMISSVCMLFGVGAAGYLGLYTKMEIYGVALGYVLSAGLAASILGCRWSERTRPESIQRIKANPEQFVSVRQCCLSIFSKKRGTQEEEITKSLIRGSMEPV